MYVPLKYSSSRDSIGPTAGLIIELRPAIPKGNKSICDEATGDTNSAVSYLIYIYIYLFFYVCLFEIIRYIYVCVFWAILLYLLAIYYDIYIYIICCCISSIVYILSNNFSLLLFILYILFNNKSYLCLGDVD